MTVRHRRVLVVEDDASIARLLQMELEHRGMEVHLVSDGRQMLPALARWRPDVVILDILLPGMDGERILYRMRAEGWKTPVLMLTARDGVNDKIRNLTTGADDYLTKPFNIDELVARMTAVLRRVEPEEVIRLADLEVDIPARRVRRSGREITLTTREFELLVVLARNARHVLSRDTLLDRVWNTLEIDPNVVDVYIGYLRKKIDANQPDRLIRTVRGVGFTLRDE
jgi:two-component system response regulator MprA/two-component system response regulator TrcR